MTITKQGFSIVEIIISTVILTIWVFWVYKLIGNNMNLISNNEALVQLYQSYTPMRECIKSIWYWWLSSYASGDIFSINFWNDNMWCFTGSYDTNFDFSWVKLDNQEYYMYARISSKTFKQIELDLNIYNTLNGYLFSGGIENNGNNVLILKNP